MTPGGIEPPRLIRAVDFKSTASACSATEPIPSMTLVGVEPTRMLLRRLLRPLRMPIPPQSRMLRVGIEPTTCGLKVRYSTI